MFGGTGNDTYVVDTVGDVVDETGGDGTDTIQTALAFSLAAMGAIENLTLASSAAITPGSIHLEWSCRYRRSTAAQFSECRRD